MNTAKPVKCVSRDYHSSPFYLIQTNGPAKRLVASFQDGQAIKSFLTTFIDASPNALQIKIRDYADHENPTDFDGTAGKVAIKTALDKYEALILQDGYHELMLRRPETGDYLVFDEHGLVYLYTPDDYSEILEQSGLTYKTNEKLIEQFDHLHYRPANAKQDLQDLISELGLIPEND
ncbi:MAG: hypothetical protein J0L99_17090 [Chitinophagales bacterium]|nr:hypothetical protein [Chitinophagales bacterium]